MFSNDNIQEINRLCEQIAENNLKLGEIRANLNSRLSTSESVTTLTFGILIGVLMGIAIGVGFAHSFF